MHNNALLYLHKLINIEKIDYENMEKLLLGFAGIFADDFSSLFFVEGHFGKRYKIKGATVALNPHFAPLIQDSKMVRIRLLGQMSKLLRLLQMSLV